MNKPGYRALAGKSVLVVDDEEIVVDVLQEALAQFASAVEAASDGYAALRKVMERDFDFILLDIEMPGMNGMDFFRHVSELKPHLLAGVIFITGDVESERSRSFIHRSGCRFIDKPFMLKDLLGMMAGCAQA